MRPYPPTEFLSKTATVWTAEDGTLGAKSGPYRTVLEKMALQHGSQFRDVAHGGVWEVKRINRYDGDVSLKRKQTPHQITAETRLPVLYQYWRQGQLRPVRVDGTTPNSTDTAAQPADGTECRTLTQVLQLEPSANDTPPADQIPTHD